MQKDIAKILEFCLRTLLRDISFIFMFHVIAIVVLSMPFIPFLLAALTRVLYHTGLSAATRRWPGSPYEFVESELHDPFIDMLKKFRNRSSAFEHARNLRPCRPKSWGRIGA
ncbi:hypothetical protein NC652_040433 [Populus alba x Populus x berolinensis]|nr:hypothetical protein NC652_040433 [Populus alba x Populus x berolinensis]